MTGAAAVRLALAVTLAFDLAALAAVLALVLALAVTASGLRRGALGLGVRALTQRPTALNRRAARKLGATRKVWAAREV
jgi:hypothetical protein